MATTDITSTLLAVAHSVGRESNNPEGGLSHDQPDNEIVECIVDIANGDPYKLGVDIDELSEQTTENILRSFFDGAYDR